MKVAVTLSAALIVTVQVPVPPHPLPDQPLNDEPALAEAVWAAGAQAVGWGASAAHRDAKALVLDGDPAALDAMRTSVEGIPAAP